MSETARRDVLVIGFGNRLRRDDAVGPAVAEGLREMGIETIEYCGDGAGLIERWEGAARVVVIDAASSAARPGAIHRFDASDASLPTGLFHYSSHRFGLAEAVETARIIGRLPPRLVIYGVEGERFDHGEGLTPAVDRAAREVTRRIAEELGAGDPGQEAG